MKYRLGISALIAMSLLTACGNTEYEAKKEESPKTTASTTQTENQTKDSNGTTVVDGVTLKEPAKDEVCAFCNMTVYQKSDEMGAFTAQAVDKDGKNLFFDDAGCMLNYERKHDVTLDKYVRNYDDKSWMKLDDAVVVKGDIKTPMHYGFAYFKDDASAKAFTDKHKGAKIVKVSDIDDVAHEKYKAANGGGHHGDSKEGHKDSEEHSDNSGH